MEEIHLYTVIIEVYGTQEVFIEQVRTSETRLDKILFAWVAQAVARGFIKGTDDPKVPFRDLKRVNEHLKALSGVFNIWRIEFLIGKDFYVKDVIIARNDGLFDVRECIFVTADFIKTSMSESSMIPSHNTPLGPNDSRHVRQAEAKYDHYKGRFIRLKGASSLPRAVNQERKQVERWMIYWDAKRKFRSQFFNRDDSGEENSLCTIVMYYRGGTYLRQFTDMPNNDVKLALLIWANDVFRDIYESKIIAPQDRVLLMEKLSQDIYTPLPLASNRNVWATYCSLSEDIAKLFVIKTALDEAVQE